MNPFLSSVPSRMLYFQILTWTKMSPKMWEEFFFLKKKGGVSPKCYRKPDGEEEMSLRPVKQLIQNFLSIIAKNRTRYSWNLTGHSIWSIGSFFDC